MQQERSTRRFPRRTLEQLLVGETTALFFRQESSSFLETEPSEKPRGGEVFRHPDGRHILVKYELGEGKKERVIVGYEVQKFPEWAAVTGYKGVVRKTTLEQIQHINIKPLPNEKIIPFWGDYPRAYKEAGFMYVPIPGIKTASNSETFESILRHLYDLGDPYDNFLSPSYKINEMEPTLGIPYTEEDANQDPLKSVENISRLLYLWKKQWPLVRFWLLGHSHGAWVAHELAKIHYDAVAGVIAFDGAVKGADPNPQNNPDVSVAEKGAAWAVGGQAAIFHLNRGKDPNTSEQIEKEVADLQQKGIVYVTFASTEDRFVGDKYAYVESANRSFCGEDIDVRFPMGVFLEKETAEEVLDFVTDETLRGILTATIRAQEAEVFVLSGLTEFAGEKFLGVEIDENLLATFEEFRKKTIEKNPLYSHGAVLAHPTVLSGIKQILKCAHNPLERPLIARYRNISPGITKKDEVEKGIGQPIRRSRTSSMDGIKEVLYYPTRTNPNLYHRIITDVSSGIVSKIGIVEDGIDVSRAELLDELLKITSTLPWELHADRYPNARYVPSGPYGYVLFLFENNGIGFLAERHKGYPLKIFYFQPNPIETLIRSLPDLMTIIGYPYQKLRFGELQRYKPIEGGRRHGFTITDFWNDNWSYRQRATSTFLVNQILNNDGLYDDDYFTFYMGPWITTGKGHNSFFLKLKGSSAISNQFFNEWLRSLWLTDEQIRNLDIRYI
ncbi:MAG: hypothetical protein Q8R11_00585 [bacterium]|nr:hypothetical protein [bacterium]